MDFIEKYKKVNLHIYLYIRFEKTMQESFVPSNYKQKPPNIKFIINEFSKPLFLNRFYINLDGLIYNSKKINFNNNKWIQNPQKFCLDHYKIHDYYIVVLLVNNIPSIFDFDKHNFKDGVILAPSEQSILKTIG